MMVLPCRTLLDQLAELRLRLIDGVDRHALIMIYLVRLVTTGPLLPGVHAWAEPGSRRVEDRYEIRRTSETMAALIASHSTSRIICGIGSDSASSK